MEPQSVTSGMDSLNVGVVRGAMMIINNLRKLDIS